MQHREQRSRTSTGLWLTTRSCALCTTAGSQHSSAAPACLNTRADVSLRGCAALHCKAAVRLARRWTLKCNQVRDYLAFSKPESSACSSSRRLRVKPRSSLTRCTRASSTCKSGRARVSSRPPGTCRANVVGASAVRFVPALRSSCCAGGPDARGDAMSYVTGISS